MSAHGRDGAPLAVVPEVGSHNVAGTEQPHSADVTEYREQHATIFARAIKASRCRRAVIADVFGHADTTIIDAMCKGDKPIAGERLIALSLDPRTARVVSIYADLLQTFCEPQLLLTNRGVAGEVTHLVKRLGHLAEVVEDAIADGQITHSEDAKIDDALDGLIRSAIAWKQSRKRNVAK